MEDGVITGGACEHIASWLLQNGYTGKILFSGVPDVFVPQGNIPELKEMYEMDGRSTAERIRDLLGGK